MDWKKSVLGGMFLVLLASLVLFGQTRVKAAETSTGSAGRFQIIIGTSQLPNNIMLLDTQSGDSWVSCLAGKQTGWCALPRFGASGTAQR